MGVVIANFAAKSDGMQLICARMQLIWVQNDVESLENRGKMQLLLQLLQTQLQIPWERSSCGCSSLQRKRSSLQLICSSLQLICTDVEGVVREATTTGEGIPSKPIGIVGVVHSLFTIFARYNGKK